MLLGGEKIVKKAGTDDMQLVYRLVESKGGKCRIEEHINFESTTTHRGTRVEMENVFNRLRKTYGLREF